MTSQSQSQIIGSAVGFFFEYDTPRIVHIRSKKVGIINRILQLTILVYIIGYVIVWKKGYQEFENVQGAVTSKLKGVVFTNFSGVPGLDGRIWDVADYVVPPQENGAFFVMTNVLVTPVQRQSTCDEDPTNPTARCETKACPRGKRVVHGNGVTTGNCINSTVDPGAMVCEVYAWCPVERDDKTTRAPTPALLGSKDFTVLIKNNIEFPKFGIQRRNIFGFTNDTQLSSCRFDPNDPLNKFCPIFNLEKIVLLTGTKYTEVAAKGCVIQIIIQWDCNLDFAESNCLPEYRFRRLDRGDYKISRGFNFRHAHHYTFENGSSARMLFKAFGIRFVVSVQGRAGQFRAMPLLLNIASGLALLSIAAIICDFIVLHVLKAHILYKNQMYFNLEETDTNEVMDEREQDHDRSRHRYSNVGASNSSNRIYMYGNSGDYYWR